MEIGDKVRWIPSAEHALEQALDGSYPWVLGWRRQLMRDGQMVSEVEELTGRKLHDTLAEMKRHPNPSENRANLILIRPQTTYPAVVRAVREDSTVDLDIEGCRSGVTLHYDAVPVAPSGTPHAPGTCVVA